MATAITRADKYSNLAKRTETYSDFSTTFARHPLTNKLVRLTDEDAVRQAFKNLILTNNGERFFQESLGSQVNASLFDPVSPFTFEDIERSVFEAHTKVKKRINLLSVRVLENIDANAYVLNVVFSLVNNPTPITLNHIIRRIR